MSERAKQIVVEEFDNRFLDMDADDAFCASTVLPVAAKIAVRYAAEVTAALELEVAELRAALEDRKIRNGELLGRVAQAETALDKSEKRAERLIEAAKEVNELAPDSPLPTYATAFAKLRAALDAEGGNE